MKLLRERRLAQGWSQQDLANRVGCTKQHISDLERGRVRPSLLLLHRLSDVLRIPDSELLMDSIANACISTTPKEEEDLRSH